MNAVNHSSSNPDASPPLFVARGVTKVYGSGDGSFHALRGIDLEVKNGETVAIVGKSGSGKSTLMHVLALLDSPTSGSVMVAGKDAKTLRAGELNLLRNQSFGFVFQQFFMIPNASVLENVVMPLKIAGVGSRERQRRGMEVLELVEMADKAGNRATNLSGGQKQRMVIARALANKPRAIFADEPTGNLDSATGEVIEDLLFGLNREHGITLIVVTHDKDLADRCGRAVYLKDGLVVDASGLQTSGGLA